MDEPSDKSRTVALVLGVVTGVFGGHRFYAGKTATGMGMLFTLGGFGIWWLYDNILIAAGEFRDWDDRKIVNWSNEPGRGTLSNAETNRRILDTMEDVRSEVFELQERVDFMERMLAEVKQRQAVPPARDR